MKKLLIKLIDGFNEGVQEYTRNTFRNVTEGNAYKYALTDVRKIPSDVPISGDALMWIRKETALEVDEPRIY